MALPLFPVYLASEGFVPPATGTYYLVAKDGIYMRVERLHGSALVRVKEIPFLAPANTTGNFALPKISALVMAQAKTFFNAVFDRYRSESYLTLLYSKKLESYRLWCPKQTVSYGSVNYDRTDTVPVEDRDYIGNDGDGWQMVGTIHSHCDFSAFHSGTDEADESTFDGVHLTFGHVNSDRFSIASSIVFNNNRSKLEPSDVALGIVGDSEEEVVEEYDSKVRGIPVKKSFTRMEYYFRLELNESELGELAGFRDTLLKDWIDKVEPRITRADSWVPSSTSKTSSDINENWEDITKGQGWLYGRKWRYGEDNSWGIQEWDGD
jgi:hypothetical protein